MADAEHGDAPGPGLPVEHLLHLLADGAGRLVEQSEAGPLVEQAGPEEALALSRGQGLGPGLARTSIQATAPLHQA